MSDAGYSSAIPPQVQAHDLGSASAYPAGPSSLVGDCIAAWSFDGTWADQVAGSNSFVSFTGTPTFVAGLGGQQAASFVSPQLAVAPYNASQASGRASNMTIGMWVYPGAHNDQVIGNNDQLGGGFNFAVVTSGGSAQIFMRTVGASIDVVWFTGVWMSLNNWHFVLWKVDIDNNIISVQVDNGAPTTHSGMGVGSPMIDNHSQLTVGNVSTGRMQSGLWVNRLTTSGEDTGLYNAGVASKNYPFNGVNSTPPRIPLDFAKAPVFKLVLDNNAVLYGTNGIVGKPAKVLIEQRNTFTIDTLDSWSGDTAVPMPSGSGKFLSLPYTYYGGSSYIVGDGA